MFRYQQFENKKREIDEHNERFYRGEETFAMKLTKFADMVSLKVLIEDTFLSIDLDYYNIRRSRI